MASNRSDKRSDKWPWARGAASHGVPGRVDRRDMGTQHPATAVAPVGHAYRLARRGALAVIILIVVTQTLPHHMSFSHVFTILVALLLFLGEVRRAEVQPINRVSWRGPEVRARIIPIVSLGLVSFVVVPWASVAFGDAAWSLNWSVDVTLSLLVGWTLFHPRVNSILSRPLPATRRPGTAPRPDR